MKTRRKTNGPVVQTRAEAEAVLGTYRELTIAHAAVQARREAELKAVDDRYAGSLDELEQRMDVQLELLRGWAEAYPAEFGGRKSLDLTHGTVGWRTGNPTVTPLSGWTWERVLEGLPPEFVRTKREVDKQRLLAERDVLTAEGLRDLGVRVSQKKPFFAEPKLDEPEPLRRKEVA